MAAALRGSLLAGVSADQLIRTRSGGTRSVCSWRWASVGGGRCATPASSGSVASEEVSAFEALCVLKGGLVALRRFDDGFT